MSKHRYPSEGWATDDGIAVRVTGRYACFTRPEMCVERVSYDAMTPSAARGVLESIYWHPGVVWVIDSIEVRNEIKFMTIRRNEVKTRVPKMKVKPDMEIRPLNADAQREQRVSRVLKDVDYIVRAHLRVTREYDGSLGKAYGIVRTRLHQGATFNAPYLGCREFDGRVTAKVPDGYGFYSGVDERDLGFMLYDMDFSDADHPHPRFFRAVMRRGVIEIPRKNDGDVVA